MTCLWGGDEIFARRVRDGWNVFAARPLLNDWGKNDLHFARPVGPTSDVAKAVLGSPIIQACHSLVEKISTSRAPFGWKSVLLPLVTRENNVSVLWQCFGFCTTDFGCPWSANQLYKNLQKGLKFMAFCHDSVLEITNRPSASWSLHRRHALRQTRLLCYACAAKNHNW